MHSADVLTGRSHDDETKPLCNLVQVFSDGRFGSVSLFSIGCLRAFKRWSALATRLWSMEVPCFEGVYSRGLDRSTESVLDEGVWKILEVGVSLAIELGTQLSSWREMCSPIEKAFNTYKE